jgi:hypothetical protein
VTRPVCWCGVLVLAIVARASAAQTPPRYTLTPDITIDSHSNDLSPVSFLVVSPHGVIAVGQSQDHVVRFFDPAGKSLGTFGREGEGPGDFRGMDFAGWFGDTLWVHDYALRRFTFVSPLRKLARTIGAAHDIVVPGDTVQTAMVTGAIALYRDGTELLAAVLPSTVSERPAWAHDDDHTDSRMVLVAVSAQGRFQRQVSLEPADDCGMVMMRGYGFCGHPKVGLGPGTELFAWATMSVAGADSGTYQVILLDRNGRKRYARRYPFTAQPIPQHVLDSVAARSRGGRDPVVKRSMMPKIPPPKTYPPVEGLVTGADGAVWVHLRATPSGVPWVMLSPRGDVIGTLMLPANVTIMTIAPGMAWGTAKDADDVESVVRYRVTLARR